MRQLYFFFRLILFWLVFFFVGRLLFLFLNFSRFSQNGFSSETLHVFYQGWKMDLSAASYLLIPAFLLLAISILFYKSFLSVLHKGLTYFLIGIVSVVLVSNARLYKDWTTPLNAKAIEYLGDPSMVMASIDRQEVFYLLGLILVLILLGCRIVSKYHLTQIPIPPLRKIYGFSLVVLTGLFLFLGIRGGIGTTPINVASAYYSESAVENHLALNPLWYLGNSLSERRTTVDRYSFMEISEALAIRDSMVRCASEESAVSSGKNVVLLILESFSSDLLLDSGYSDVTPFLRALSEDGIYFSNIYSSGFRTDQGLASILSGYPAQPDQAILRYPHKIETLPGIFEEFLSEGYQTSFFYGGDLGFANMKLLLMNGGVSQVIDDSHKALDSLNQGRWGVHDHSMLNLLSRHLSSEAQPFASGLLTLSLHAPYDFPGRPNLSGMGDIEKYILTAGYLDRALQSFFVENSDEQWFHQTLFVICGDHGSLVPGSRTHYDPGTRRTPLIFYGPALSDSLRGLHISAPGNLHDIPATLGHILGQSFPGMLFSRNLLCHENAGFAYLAYEPGMGWVNREGSFVYHEQLNRMVWPGAEVIVHDSVRRLAEAYHQSVWHDFNSR